MEVSESRDGNRCPVVEVEEIKVVTKLTMASRKLKIKISNELLMELEKMQVNFKLNRLVVCLVKATSVQMSW
jgi:DNA polymerase-3 subunit alpha